MTLASQCWRFRQQSLIKVLKFNFLKSHRMTMPSFTLQLNLSPAFGRHCVIRIESGIDGTATFEAPQAGLLPRVELTLSVTAEQTAMIYQRCSALLVGEKEKKDDIGLDGISIYGVFTPADLKPQAFFLWSPRVGDDAHLMLAATLACFAFFELPPGSTQTISLRLKTMCACFPAMAI